MATRYWIGSSLGTWNNTANWSTSSGGAGGASVPTTGDDVVVDKSISAESVINVNQDIGGIATLQLTNPGSGGAWLLAGTSVSTAGSTWTIPVAGVTINVPAGKYSGFSNATAGTGTITKTGDGGLYNYNTAAVWGSNPIDLQGGALGVGTANNKLGSGTITMSDGTALTNITTTARSIQNPVNVNGNITLNVVPHAPTFGAAALTLTGTVAFGAVNRTVTVGGTGGAANNSATLSGAITGTAGFTKAGTGALFITKNAGTTLSGVITQSSAYVQLGSTTTSGDVFPVAGITSWAVNTSTTADPLAIQTNVTVDPLHIDTFTGTGGIQCYTATGAYIQFKAGALVGLSPAAASHGFSVQPINSGVTSTLKVRDFPASGRMTWIFGGNTQTGIFDFNGTSAGTYSPSLAILRYGALTGLVPVIAANGAAGAALTLSGTLTTEQTGGSTITLTLRGTNTDNNTYSGVMSNGANTLAVTKSEAGRWILSGANTYTGTTTVSAGTLSAQSAGAFGTSGAVTQTGGTIDVSGGVALTKTGAAFTLVSNAGANALTTTTGTNTLACAGITLSSTIIVDAAAGASLTVNNTAAMSGPFGITKNNSGEIGLGTFANTYTGAVTINAGTLTVGNLQSTSTASSLGTGALSSAIVLSGTLKYNGTGHSTNRSITFTGAAPALDASGSGAVTYSAATQAAGARTITFTGSSTAANTLSAALSDGTGAVSVAKSGAGKWVLSNATLNYTGTTSVSDGTLNFGSTNRTLSGALSVSGGTVENSTNTISANTTMSGGTITAQLTGNKTLDVTSGNATLQPVNNVNDFSGNTTVAAGATLKLITGLNPSLGSGRVLGTSNVSVSGNLRTDGSVTQKGQMRYGGNLTFQAGAKLYVGSLA